MPLPDPRVADDQDALLGGAKVARAVKQAGADAGSVLGAEVVMLRGGPKSRCHYDKHLANRDDARALPVPGTRCRCRFANALARNVARTARSVSSNCRANGRGRPTSWSPITRCSPSMRCTAGPRCPAHDRHHRRSTQFARVTGAAGQELGAPQIERVARLMHGRIDNGAFQLHYY